MDEVKEEWNEIMKEVAKIKAKGEQLVLVGDLNAHTGNIVEGNHSRVTARGKLVCELVESGEVVLVNSLDVVKGGPFTRYDPKSPNETEKKSLLDYIIVSANLVKYIDSLEIDSKLGWTPSRPVKGNLKFPDHYALLLSLKTYP